MIRDRAKKALTKKARKGFRGYPVATIAFYGPTDKKATKIVVGIVVHEDAGAEPLRKWFSETDVRNDHVVLEEALDFIREQDAQSVVMVDRIIGCPHEEGIDYAEGGYCPQCPFWKNRDRWTGDAMH